MSNTLTAILNNAAEGTSLTCTLSPESVQVIFFALGFIEDFSAWKSDEYDTVSDAEKTEITELLEKVSVEILP